MGGRNDHNEFGGSLQRRRTNQLADRCITGLNALQFELPVVLHVL